MIPKNIIVNPQNATAQLTKLNILTLNMHLYQELEQEKKFKTIVDAIQEQKIDIILLQECAQHRESQRVIYHIKADNMALILQEMLRKKYGLNYYQVWDFVHYGFKEWEEGIAILSHYPISFFQSRMLSTTNNEHDINTRKAICVQIQHPRRSIHCICTHLSMESEEQHKQIVNLHHFIEDMEKLLGTWFIVGGDFNMRPANPDYDYLTKNTKLADCYALDHPSIDGKCQSPENNSFIGSPAARIDYLLMNNIMTPHFLSSEYIFTPKNYGIVSDHYGLLARFSLQ